MRVSFFGHRLITKDIEPLLRKVLVRLIEDRDANDFYVGNQGDFDRIVRKMLKSLKNEYPHIRYSVVLAYMPVKNSAIDSEDAVFPEGFEKFHPKYAISLRNKWMVDKSDLLVTYVTSVIGGAARFKELAEKKGKEIINLPSLY